MLGNGRHITRSRLFEQIHPGVGVKCGCREQGNEILVPEMFHVAEPFFEVLVLGGAFAVHMARIPLVESLRDGPVCIRLKTR